MGLKPNVVRGRVADRFGWATSWVIVVVVLAVSLPHASVADGIGSSESVPFDLYLAPGFNAPSAGGGVGWGSSFPFTLYLSPGFGSPGSGGGLGAASTGSFALCLTPWYRGPGGGGVQSDASAAFEVCLGFMIARVLPARVNWKDTGVDLIVEGCGFDSLTNPKVFTTPRIAEPDSTKRWNSQRLHLRADIGGASSPGTVAVRVHNARGDSTEQKTIRVRDISAALNHPRDYAPTFWFAPDEKWFPASPFFTDNEGETRWDTADDRIAEYNALSSSQQKAQAVVYYYVYGSHPGETPVIFPEYFNEPCYVYEYWLYYVFDDFDLCSKPMNKHQHDWERFFVFVRATDLAVVALAATAHLDPWTPGNVYHFSSNGAPAPPYHPDVLVEKGSHANCPDRNSNGRYDGYPFDVNGSARSAAWGIKDGVNQGRLALAGPGAGVDTYRLAALMDPSGEEGLQPVVDSHFTRFYDLGPNSLEAHCKTCGSGMGRRLFTELLKLQSKTTTFVNSATVEPEPGNLWMELFPPRCTGPHVSCWDLEHYYWIFGHMPIEHAWEGQQAAYVTDPLKILRRGHQTTGWLSNIGSAGACTVALLFPQADHEGGGWKATDSTTPPSPSFAYTTIADDGSLGFQNLDEGVYSFSVEADSVAPFQQNVQVSATDSLLGINGAITLVPLQQAFTLRVAALTSDGIPLSSAQVRAFASNDSLTWQSLTDLMGESFASLDTTLHYKLTVSYSTTHATYRDSVTSVWAARGDTATVTFTLPLRLSGVDDPQRPPTESELLQCYPNPFNGSTLLTYTIAAPSRVTLEIFDVNGRRIRVLRSETLPAGFHKDSWDGRDEQGAPLPSGVYTYRLRAGATTASKKLVLIR